MPHHLRYQSTDWATHHITSRCVQGYSFLKPTQEVTAIIKGVLCYNLHRYRRVIELHHYAFLSNHFHLLMSAAKVGHMSNFLRDFKGQLAKELCRVHEWQGPIWRNRFSSEEILDEGALEDTFKYITQNSVKEGLVNHPREWSGAHGYHQLVQGHELRGLRVNRSQLCAELAKVKGSSDLVDERDFTTEYTARLTPPPMWQSDHEDAYQDRCKRLSEVAIKEAVEKRASGAMGMKKVLNQTVLTRRVIKRSPRPLCRTKCAERLKAFKAAYLTFKVQYQEASATLRDAISQGIEHIRIRFPEGGVPPFGCSSLEFAI